jgi:hypothetical protein
MVRGETSHNISLVIETADPSVLLVRRVGVETTMTRYARPRQEGHAFSYGDNLDFLRPQHCKLPQGKVDQILKLIHSFLPYVIVCISCTHLVDLRLKYLPAYTYTPGYKHVFLR